VYTRSPNLDSYHVDLKLLRHWETPYKRDFKIQTIKQVNGLLNSTSFNIGTHILKFSFPIYTTHKHFKSSFKTKKKKKKIYAPHYLVVMYATSFQLHSMIFTRQKNQNVKLEESSSFSSGTEQNLKPQTSLHFIAESRDIFSCLLPTETTSTASIFNHNSNTKWGKWKRRFQLTGKSRKFWTLQHSQPLHCWYKHAAKDM